MKEENVVSTPMSAETKQFPAGEFAETTAPMSLSKKGTSSGEPRPVDYRPESVFGKNK